MSDQVEEISGFCGVYLLITTNPRYKGRTYIGFTVDPDRRIKQHNRGTKFGGAAKTSNRGPWEMLLVVHGFPTQIAALRFEWAWQHPKRSRRLAHIPKKKAAERMFDYNFRLMTEMLHCPPWNRLPLTIRWLRPEVKFKEFARRPPPHMQIVQGHVKSIHNYNKKAKEPIIQDEDNLICSVCFENVDQKNRIRCLSEKCGAVSHIICLAQKFRDKPSNLLPVEGNCPVCEVKSLWGELMSSRNAILKQQLQSSQQQNSQPQYSQQPTKSSPKKSSKQKEQKAQSSQQQKKSLPKKSSPKKSSPKKSSPKKSSEPQQQEEELDEFDMMVDF